MKILIKLLLVGTSDILEIIGHQFFGDKVSDPVGIIKSLKLKHNKIIYLKNRNSLLGSKIPIALLCGDGGELELLLEWAHWTLVLVGWTQLLQRLE